MRTKEPTFGQTAAAFANALGGISDMLERRTTLLRRALADMTAPGEVDGCDCPSCQLIADIREELGEEPKP